MLVCNLKHFALCYRQLVPAATRQQIVQAMASNKTLLQQSWLLQMLLKVFVKIWRSSAIDLEVGVEDTEFVASLRQHVVCEELWFYIGHLLGVLDSGGGALVDVEFNQDHVLDEVSRHHFAIK
jgi:hypothetical protein